MQDPDSPSAGASRPPRPGQGHALYVITLVSSPAPARLQVPDAPELADLALFRSRLVEDGRERFRLHVGYFHSTAEAERLLPALRRTYPAAFVAPAPRSNMGSLDDTALARFRVLQAPDAAAADPQPPARPSRPKAAVRRIVAAVPAATAATAPMPPVLHVPPEARAAAAAALQPQRARPVAPAKVPEPRRIEPVVGAEIPEPRRIEPEVRAEVAVAQPAEPMARARVAEPPGTEPAAHAEVLQKYAVQLMWTREPIDVTQIARLKIFNGYLLYAVESEPGGRHEYGVRLGFYGDALSAGLVAQYVRPVFKNATVVPVSERELERAAAAKIRVAPARAAGGRAHWPASPVSVVAVRAAR
jgi:hypothetical protein